MRLFKRNETNVEKMKAEKDLNGLIRALKDNDCEVQEAAADALGEMGDVRAVEPLINALKDEDSEIHFELEMALKKIGKPAVEPLIEALKDNVSFVRGMAAWGLGEIKDARAVEPLINALKDENSIVRKAAKDALRENGWKNTV